MLGETSLKLRLMAMLSLLFLLLLMGLFWNNLSSTRDFLVRQLSSHAQDAATSLSLRLAMHLQPFDRAATENTLSAMFDAGYYRSIRLAGPDGGTLYERSQPVIVENVPDWFVHNIALNAPAGRDEISTGWKIAGSVTVESHTGLAYRQLWEIASATLLLSLAGWLLASLAIYWVVNFALRPLDEMAGLARKVSLGEFPRLDKRPHALELRVIGEALDTMSQAVEGMLSEKSGLIMSLETELNLDPVTGLRNRRYLSAALASAIDEREELPRMLMIGRVGGFQEFNREYGRSAGNALLRKIADAMHPFAGDDLLVRMDGPQFALLSVELETSEILEKMTALTRAVNLVARQQGLQFHAGVASVRHFDSVSDWKSAADQALKYSEQDNLALFVDPVAESHFLRQDAFIQAMDDGMVSIHLQAVNACASGQTLAFEALTRWRINGDELPVTPSLSKLRSAGLLPAFDRIVLERVLGICARQLPATATVSANLAAESLLDDKLFQWLLNLPGRNPETFRRFYIEIPMAAIMREDLRQRLLQLKTAGVGVVIDHYTLEPRALDILREIRPEWIKLDPAVTRSLDRPGAGHLLLKALCEYALGLRILTCACGVETEHLKNAVIAAGFDAMQGHAISAPESPENQAAT